MRTVMSTVEGRLTEVSCALPEAQKLPPPGVKLPFPWVRVVGLRAMIPAHGPTSADGGVAEPLVPISRRG